MNKEQIKKFWEKNKVEIIGGGLVVGALILVGVSVGVAANANKLDHRAKIDAGYKAFCDNAVALGAEMQEGCPYPVASRALAESILDKGEVYLLDGAIDHPTKVIYILDKDTAMMCEVTAVN